MKVTEAPLRYTVKKLAKLSGVSVRTLHFYDEIGLLAPAYYGDNGYRYYEEEQLLMLQQILFYRELGLPLDEIQTIVTSGEFDKIAALESHREALKAKAERTAALLTTIDRTLARLKGKHPMKDEQMYQGFDPLKQAEHEKYLVDRYGPHAQKHIDESKRRTKHWKKEDYASVQLEFREISEAMAGLLKKKAAPDSVDVQKVTARHFQVIRKFYEPTKEVYAGLGQLYVDHPDFRKNLDAVDPALAEFFAAAMKAYAERNL